jgi:hypothetical protein
MKIAGGAVMSFAVWRGVDAGFGQAYQIDRRR